MTATIKITDFRREIDISPDIASQGHAVYRGLVLGVGTDLERWHIGGDGESQLIANPPLDRDATINMVISGLVTEAQALTSDISQMLRQAAAAQMSKTTRRVYLSIQKEGSPNEFLHEIKRGRIDTSRSSISEFTDNTNPLMVKEWVAPINLRLGPYGEAKDWLSLDNSVQNGHFLYYP